MTVHREFPRDEIYPSYFVNRIQDFISGLVGGIRLTRLNDTTLRVPASAGDGIVALGVQGRWRFVTVNVDRAVSGVAETKDVFLVAAENNVTSVPDPNTDATNYAFDLRIVSSGTTPVLSAGVVDIFRKIGEADWDGAVITGVRQTLWTVGAEMLAAGLRPSQGAAAGTEALRALGTTGSTAAAGNDPRIRFTSGLRSARPAAGNPGTRFFATDCVAEFLDTGADWVRTGMEAGMIVSTLRASPPPGYLLADGGPVSDTGATADLFTAIGGTLPNLVGKVPVGRDAAQAEFDVLGESGGAKTHALSLNELASHLHGDGTLATDVEAAHTHPDGTLAVASHAHADGTLAATNGGAHNHGIHGWFNSHDFGNPGNSLGGGGLWHFGHVSFTTGVFQLAGSHSAVSDLHGGHTHPVAGSTASAAPDVNGATGSGGAHDHDVTGATGPSGGGAAHANLQPYQVVNYMVKL